MVRLDPIALGPRYLDLIIHPWTRARDTPFLTYSWLWLPNLLTS
jgi:hypothetical protein